MSWTQFQIEMHDGKRFHFGTTFLMEFFQIPDGYGVEDMAHVLSAPPLSPRPEGFIHRERPFFTCHVPGLKGMVGRDPT